MLDTIVILAERGQSMSVIGVWSALMLTFAQHVLSWALFLLREVTLQTITSFFSNMDVMLVTASLSEHAFTA